MRSSVAAHVLTNNRTLAQPAHPLDAPLRGARAPASEDPFQRIGIVTDHLHVSYANGSSFASQFLHREFVRRGHDVTLVGPAHPRADPRDLPPERIVFSSRELRNHPGLFIPFPSRGELEQVTRKRFDLLLGQTTTGMLELGAWLRRLHHVPYLCVNTAHLPSLYNVLLPDGLSASTRVRRLFDERVIPAIEACVTRTYNASDGLIVLCQGMKRYWQERGVEAPIFVIPRSIEPKIFDRSSGLDPFDVRAPRGGRLLVVCRHTREKGLSRLLHIFARQIAPQHATATLTLVGDGPDHDCYRQLSRKLGVADRVFFPGEQPLFSVPDYYRSADLFLYTSLSDTYGQVISEALWCGLPSVALADCMGVSQQMLHGETGLLVDARLDEPQLEREFGASVLALLNDPGRRAALARSASAHAHHRSSPERCVERYYGAFGEARRHLRESVRRGIPTTHDNLANWRLMHGLLFALGYVRRRSVVNKNQSRHPGWSASLESATVRAVEQVAERAASVGRRSASA